MQIHGLGWTSKYSPPPPQKKFFNYRLTKDTTERTSIPSFTRLCAPYLLFKPKRKVTPPSLCSVTRHGVQLRMFIFHLFSHWESSPTRGLHQGPKQICSRHRARYIPRWSTTTTTTTTTTTSSLAGIRDGASPRGGSWQGLICIYVCCVRGRKTFCTPLQFRCCACVAMACTITKKIDPYQPPAPCWVSPVLCCLCVLRALCRATGIRQLAVGSEVLVSGSVIVGFLLQC